MPQSNVIFGFLAVAFFVYITARGELGTYISFFVGGGTTSLTPGAASNQSGASTGSSGGISSVISGVENVYSGISSLGSFGISGG